MNLKPSVVPEAIREKVGTLPGVRDVDWSRYPEEISLRCDSSAVRQFSGEAISTILAEESGTKVPVRVELAPPGASRSTRRARFESIRLTAPEPGHILASVTLEWNREKFDGEGSGDSSVAGEIRASALATIVALEKVLGGEVPFSLIGAKEMRVFDHDMIAVLLRSPRFADRHLIGTSVITDDRRRAAALAVLNATNRAVGSLTL